MHDRDTKFTAGFDAALEKAGLDARRSAYRAPNTAAYVERFVQSIKQECLDYFVVFGQRHMDYLCREFLEHYHAERPHQGLDNELLAATPRKKKAAARPDSSGRCRLPHTPRRPLKHYYRKAA